MPDSPYVEKVKLERIRKIIAQPNPSSHDMAVAYPYLVKEVERLRYAAWKGDGDG